MGKVDAHPADYTIRMARSTEDFNSFREIVLEFSEFLNVDLSFQNFEEEMAGLPGCYGPPGGAIVIASVQTDAGMQDAGVVAVRALPQKGSSQHGEDPGGPGGATAKGGLDGLNEYHSIGSTCEMKRLYVRPQYQGRQLGRALCEELIRISREMGYEYMVLDTLERLEAAGRMYTKLGFEQCPPYYHNPNPGVVYWRKRLQE